MSNFNKNAIGVLFAILQGENIIYTREGDIMPPSIFLFYQPFNNASYHEN